MQDRSGDLLANIREIVHVWKNSHSSVFSFHWKRIWPFRLFWPQVDYARLVRILTKSIDVADEQIQFLKGQLRTRGPEGLATFYSEAEKYIQILQETSGQLRGIAQYRQDVLERKYPHGFRDWDHLVVMYQQSCNKCVETAASCQEAYLKWIANKADGISR